jgi:PAS domain S-box-containing protein
MSSRLETIDPVISNLLEATSSLVSSLDLSDVLSKILRLAEMILAADAYAVWGCKPEDTTWRVIYSAGLSPAYTDQKIETSSSAWTNFEPVIAEDVNTIPLVSDRRELYRRERVKSFIAYPIRTFERGVGTVTFYFHERREMTSDLVQAGQLLANISNAAINAAEILETQKSLRRSAQQAAERAEFLAYASNLLASSLDYKATLNQLTQLAVLKLADWCSVSVVEGGRLQRIAAAHSDPAKLQLVNEYSDKFPTDLNDPRGVSQVIREGTPQLIPHVTDEMLRQAVSNQEQYRILSQLGMQSVLIVPLISRGTTLGALTLVTSESGRALGNEDLGIAEALALRAAVAIDNSRLYEAMSKSSNDAGHLAAIVESSDDAIVSKNLDGIINSWNQSAERLFGYRAEEAIGRHITLIIPPERRSEEDTIISRIRQGGRVDHFETFRQRKDGSLVEVSLTISPVKDSAGRIVGASKVARDITERRRSEWALREGEERLRKTEKLAAAGQLAASLAHEINNPLSSVTNALYLLDSRSELDQGARGLIEIARTELARTSRIVKQSLSYYRTGTVPKDVNIAAMVEESLQVFSAKFDRCGIQLTKEIARVDSVSGFGDEIRQVIDNLLLNAIESMPDGGRLNVSVRWSREWNNGFRQGVRMTLADSGSGIPKEVRARIFEPFFTTKQEKGTGLGLWVVRGIVAKHEGSIRVRSSVKNGKTGTVVSVLWPQSSRPQQWSATVQSVSLV